MTGMSRMPARTASSTTYWMAGLSTTGSISLGCALVAGRNRVPSPAAGMIALRTLISSRFLRAGGPSSKRPPVLGVAHAATSIPTPLRAHAATRPCCARGHFEAGEVEGTAARIVERAVAEQVARPDETSVVDLESEPDGPRRRTETRHTVVRGRNRHEADSGEGR